MNQFVKRWVFSISCSFFSEFVRHYEAKQMVFACLTKKLDNISHNSLFITRTATSFKSDASQQWTSEIDTPYTYCMLARTDSYWPVPCTKITIKKSLVSCNFCPFLFLWQWLSLVEGCHCWFSSVCKHWRIWLKVFLTYDHNRVFLGLC